MARLGNEQRAESAVLRNLLQVRPAAASAARRGACNPIAGVDSARYRRRQGNECLPERRQHLIDAGKLGQRQDRRIMGGAVELAAPGRQRAGFRRPGPAPELLARQQRSEECALLCRRRRNLVGERALTAFETGFAIFAFRHQALKFQFRDQLGVRLDIELEPTVLHAHRRGDGADLNFVSRRLIAQRRKDALRQPPFDDGVERRVSELFFRQMCNAPIAGLLRFVQGNVELSRCGVGESVNFSPNVKTTGLQGAVHFAERNVGMFEK